MRLALDNTDLKDQWEQAYQLLRKHGVVKRSIDHTCFVALTPA